MMNVAEEWGLRPDGSNPCRHVKKYRELKRERYLTKEEFGRVGDLWDKEKKTRDDRNPDKHHFFDLLYLGFLGHIEHRGKVEEDLKELKRMLDKTADKMMEIVDKSEGRAKSN
jgi:hypothetical protein